jgi:hypothetical protein
MINFTYNNKQSLRINFVRANSIDNITSLGSVMTGCFKLLGSSMHCPAGKAKPATRRMQLYAVSWVKLFIGTAKNYFLRSKAES